MKLVLWSSVVCGLVSALPLQAQTLFYDNFENGIGGDIVYAPWGNVSGDPHTPNGQNNLITTAENHALSGTHSARAWEADPAHWNGFADFGATGAGLRATVHLFEDMHYVPPYTDLPPQDQWKAGYIEVRSMFSLFGDNSSNALGDSIPNTDYLQLRLIPDVDRPQQPMPDHYSYGIETKYNDDHGLGIIDTGVLREKSQWMKLEIDADSMADGGQVRFYINDALVGTSYRSGPDLRWVMLGSNKITYENYWYDDVSVVDNGDYGDYWHGDFNGNGFTDAADYVMWRKGNLNGQNGYNTWRANFGMAPAAGGSSIGAAVPEPAALWALALISLPLLTGLRRRSRW